MKSQDPHFPLTILSYLPKLHLLLPRSVIFLIFGVRLFVLKPLRC